MWKTHALSLPDAYLIELPKFEDQRGSFVKTFQKSFIDEKTMPFDLKESYFSISKKQVIRGMHFQIPPFEHEKIVFCPQGAILDVLLDLRPESPTFGEFYSQILSAENHLAYYIPKGFAHGFKSLEDNSITYYLVSSEHNTTADKGILYNSFGMEWGDEEGLVLSDRDLQFPALEAFNAPF